MSIPHPKFVIPSRDRLDSPGFSAMQYVVAFGSTCEFGPLLMAVTVSGRSLPAFAALGSSR